MGRRTGEAEAMVPAEGDAWSTAWHFGAGEPPPRLRGASEPDAVGCAERTRCEMRDPEAGISPERNALDFQMEYGKVPNRKRQKA